MFWVAKGCQEGLGLGFSSEGSDERVFLEASSLPFLYFQTFSLLCLKCFRCVRPRLWPPPILVVAVAGSAAAAVAAAAALVLWDSVLRGLEAKLRTEPKLCFKVKEKIPYRSLTCCNFFLNPYNDIFHLVPPTQRIEKKIMKYKILGWIFGYVSWTTYSSSKI